MTNQTRLDQTRPDQTRPDQTKFLLHILFIIKSLELDMTPPLSTFSKQKEISFLSWLPSGKPFP